MFNRQRTRLVIAASLIATLLGTSLGSTAQAEEVSIGFSPSFTDISQFSLRPGTTHFLNSRVSETKDSASILRPLFGKVQGYPSDTQLLASIKLSGPTGTTFSFWASTLAPADSRSITFDANNQAATTVTLAPGLSSWNQLTEIAFTGRQESVNKLLSTMYVQTPNAIGQVSLKFVVTRDEGAVYNIENNHFYKFVDWSDQSGPDYVAAGANRTWTKALADAESLTYKGVKGHLATITSESENLFVRDRLGQARNVFLAGSDKDTEGQWKWNAGPEKDQVFWEARCVATNTCNGDVTYIDRTPAKNTYSAWAVSDAEPENVNKNEPNDWGAGVANAEDYLVANRFVPTAVTQDPRWNDLPIGGSFIGGYVAEFSGSVADYSGVYTRDVSINIRPENPSLVVKRTSQSAAKVGVRVRQWTSATPVEIQRRTGKKPFVTVGKVTPVISEGKKASLYQIDFVDKLPAGNTLVSHDYRALVKVPGGSTEIISNTGNIPIESKIAKLVADLTFKVGQHITNLSSSIFKGIGLKPKSIFRITLRSEPVVLVDDIVGSDGSISAEIAIPESTEPGDHTVTIEGIDTSGKAITAVANFSLDDDLIVTKVNGATTTGKIKVPETLPATGNESRGLSGLAAVFLALGVGLIFVRRRLTV